MDYQWFNRAKNIHRILALFIIFSMIIFPIHIYAEDSPEEGDTLKGVSASGTKQTSIHVHLKGDHKSVEKVSVILDGNELKLTRQGNHYEAPDGGEYVSDKISSIKVLLTDGFEQIFSPAGDYAGVEAGGTINYWITVASPGTLVITKKVVNTEDEEVEVEKGITFEVTVTSNVYGNDYEKSFNISQGTNDGITLSPGTYSVVETDIAGYTIPVAAAVTITSGQPTPLEIKNIVDPGDGDPGDGDPGGSTTPTTPSEEASWIEDDTDLIEYEEIELEIEEIPAGVPELDTEIIVPPEQLPMAGQLPPMLFYGLGLTMTAFGFRLKRR